MKLMFFLIFFCEQIEVKQKKMFYLGNTNMKNAIWIVPTGKSRHVYNIMKNSS